MTATLPRIGEDFAGFGLRSVLGRGGMSVVYEAENRRLGSTIALKVLAPDLANDDVFRERFLKESRVAAALSHPNVIPIYDVGPYDELLYIAMRYVRGSDLRTILKAHERIVPAQALVLVGQAGRALDAAHREGLVHRDVKPANFLVERGAPDDPDHLYLADFGITKHALSRSGLTATGQFVGTIDYIAPEQIQDKHVDARADIYSLGCVLYECLTGRVPFTKNVDAAVIWAHVEEMPTAPSTVRPELPRGIDEVIDRALAKNPDDRYSTCHEFLADAHAVFDGSTTRHTGEGLAVPTVLADTSAPGPPDPAQGLTTASAPTADGDAHVTRSVEDSSSGATAVRSRGGGTNGATTPPGGTADGQGEQGFGGGEDQPGRRRTRGPSRRGVPLALAGIALLVAGVVAWLLVGSSGHKSHPKTTSAAQVQNPILVALGRANQSVDAKGLLPPSSCKAEGASMATCSQPAFSIQTVMFRTYPSLAALYGAYVAEGKSLNQGEFRTNAGDCTPQMTDGEVSWNHNFEHPRGYSLALSQSGKLADEKAAGRLFCVFSNSQYHLIWTMNDGRLLASLTGAPHTDAWNWWHGVHHAIDLTGSASPSSMQMSNGQMSNGK
ncbi:MAG: serine/threonine protein kinase [Solirubrobacterales bacterium]|nr:serine/threonine protein kinase [Solirubrobacterales bacterium]